MMIINILKERKRSFYQLKRSFYQLKPIYKNEVLFFILIFVYLPKIFLWSLLI